MYSLNLRAVDAERPVAFMPGTEDWELDLSAATRHVYKHTLQGEGEIAGDYFSDDLFPSSSSATIEIVHQYLQQFGEDSAHFVRKTDPIDRKIEMELIIQAKDLYMTLLLRSYFGVMRSRAHRT